MKRTLALLLLLAGNVCLEDARAAVCQYTVTSPRDYIPRPANDNDALNNGQCELFEAVQNVGLGKDVFEDCQCVPAIGAKEPTIQFAGVSKIVFGNGAVEDGKPKAVAGTNEPINIHPNTVALRIVGPVQLSGNHRTRLFAIGGPSSLVLEKVAMSDGISDYNAGLKPTVGNGGLILLTNSSAKLSLKDLWMVGGEAMSGGAVWAGGGEITLQSVSCSQNKAYGAPAVPQTGLGGCLRGGDVVTIKDSLFHTNLAEHGGGALDFADPESKVTITDSKFISNIETSNDGQGGGGAIFSTASLSCTNCVFDQNTSASRGGAFQQGWTSACATFVGTLFRENAVNHPKRAIAGGAVFSTGCTIVQQSTFEQNYVHEGDFSLGGAIYAGGGSLDVGNTTFFDNFADTWGGALAIENTKLRFANNTLTDNDAEGALFWTLPPDPGQAIVMNNILVQTGGACAGNTADVTFVANLEFPEKTCGDPVSSDPQLDGPAKPLDPATGKPSAAADLGHQQFVPKAGEALFFKGVPEGCIPSPVGQVDKNGKPRDEYCTFGDIEL